MQIGCKKAQHPEFFVAPIAGFLERKVQFKFVTYVKDQAIVS